MDRRAFLAKSAFIGSLLYFNEISKTSGNGLAFEDHDEEMYAIFKDPSSLYRPFVRWWWNGNKVDSEEILRELRLMKSIGIGGVEINPIEFPPTADDMGIESVEWLSPKWVDLVKGACEDAHSLGMINDLIVGSGWPFGMETLKEEERAQVMIVYAKELEGPVKFTTSGFNIIEEVDPGVTVKPRLSDRDFPG